VQNPTSTPSEEGSPVSGSKGARIDRASITTGAGNRARLIRVLGNQRLRDQIGMLLSDSSSALRARTRAD